ncbi:hypothetical protein [Ascidiimonas sp. W6]|uniref:hypothetical protein n=1 Tax=Ascidiimonas meishanensis TaxID=3128903 RepID=UPI0030EC2A23
MQNPSLHFKYHLLAVFLFMLNSLLAQEKMPTDSTATKTIDGTVKEVLHIISGEKGKVRDWVAFRNLFLPSVRFTILNQFDKMPDAVETVTLDEFIELMNDTYYGEGFIEYEIGKVVDEYNGIAQVFQSFYAKDSEDSEGRGITSYQLVYFNNRWWIANLVWSIETEDHPIPPKYLNNQN